MHRALLKVVRCIVPLRSFRVRGPTPLFARIPHYFGLCAVVTCCSLVVVMGLGSIVRALWCGAFWPLVMTTVTLAAALTIGWVALRFGRVYETRHGVMFRRGGQWRVVPWSAVSGVFIPWYNDHSRIFFTNGTKAVRFVGNRRIGDHIEARIADARIAAANAISPARTEPYR